MKQSAILIIAAIALFFVGRFTAPPKEVEDTRRVDSITRELVKHIKGEQMWKDSSAFKDILATTWFNEAMKNKKGERVIITKFNEDTTRNRSLTVLQRDSAIRAIFLKN